MKDLVNIPKSAITVRAPQIPSMKNFKNMSLAEILDVLVFVSHLIAGDPDVPGDSGILGDDIMNYQLPAVGKTVKCVFPCFLCLYSGKRRWRVTASCFCP